MDQIEIKAKVLVNTRSNDPEYDYRWHKTRNDDLGKYFKEVETYSKELLDIKHADLPSLFFIARDNKSAVMIPFLPTARSDHVGRKITNTLYLEKSDEVPDNLQLLVAWLLTGYDGVAFKKVAEFTEVWAQQLIRYPSNTRDTPILPVPKLTYKDYNSNINEWKDQRIAVRSTKKHREDLARHLAMSYKDLLPFALALTGKKPDQLEYRHKAIPKSFWVLTSSEEINVKEKVSLVTKPKPPQKGNVVIELFEDAPTKVRQNLHKFLSDVSARIPRKTE